MRGRRAARIGGSSLILVAIGQSALVAAGPLTRAPRASGGTAGVGGIALLSPDSEYYLDLSGSTSILGQTPPTRIMLPLLLRLGSTLGSAETFLVCLNLLALLLAGMALHDLVLRLGGTSAAGMLATGALVVNPLTAQWARFVLTETLAYAAVVGILWAILRFGSRRTLGAFVVILLLGGFLTLLRPNGILVLAGSLSAVVATSNLIRRRNGVQRGLIHGVIWVVAFALALIASREPDPGVPATENVIVSRLYDGVIIEGTPEVLVTTLMPPPADPSDASLSAAIAYAIRHPLPVAKLGALRVIYETLPVRPHYPAAVNLVLGFGFALFVLLVLVGARVARSRLLRDAVSMLSVPQMLLVAATFAVPESRYGWTYLVTLCVWAGIGGDRILARSRAVWGPQGRPGRSD